MWQQVPGVHVIVLRAILAIQPHLFAGLVILAHGNRI